MHGLGSLLDENLRFMGRQQARGVGIQAPINVMVVTESVPREISRGSARGQSDVHQPKLMVAFEGKIMWGLEGCPLE